MLVRWIGLVIALATGATQAQPDIPVPTELEDWRDWVLDGHEYRACPFRFDTAATAEGEFICAWPGELALDVDAVGGRFSQEWTVYGSEAWLPLPGSEDAWPQQVLIGGRPVEVVSRSGVPSVNAPPGNHRVVGTLAWDARPATLDVPPQSALLALDVDGVRIALPKVDEKSVWLGAVEPAAAIPDALAVDVYRRIVDEIPTRLDTVIELSVSGKVREETLRPVLPDGFVPLALVSELPALLEPDGGLRLQARPGDWQVELWARADGVRDEIARPQTADNVPADEIWSFEARPHLRAAVAESRRPVDPLQVGSPWRELPAFRVASGETVVISERRRGMANTGNEIHLSRLLWLDFDGTGFVFADRITGRMLERWRLDMAMPFALLSATEADDALQITASEGRTGVEVRRARLDVAALGRVETRGPMPVVGWSNDAMSADTTLHLPPGHRLLAAVGADAAPTSWIGRWRVLDLFVLLIVTVAVGRLFGPTAGTLALVAVALSYHELGAPVWTWLNLLAAAALVRVAPPGKLASAARGYRLASFAVLLLWLVPFVLGQIRIAVYPQLEPESHRTAATVGFAQMLAEVRGSAPVGAVVDSVDTKLRSAELGEVVLDSHETAAAPESGRPYLRYPEGALVQAGTGRPDWTWTAHPLRWSGPVAEERSMRLVVAPAWLVAILRFATVGALGAFAALFALDMLATRRPDWRWLARAVRPTGTAAAMLLGVVLVGPGEPAFAEVPPNEVLEELERRLLEPPSCTPRCAEIAEARVDVGENAVSMRLEVHAQASVALPLPGAAAGWRATQVEDAEGRGLAVYRDDSGVSWVHLDAGVHTLALSGPIPPGDAVEIPFALLPRAVRATSAHWSIAGIENRVLVAGSLNLARLPTDDDAAQQPTWEANRLPDFLAVERSISMDLDWEMFTVVRRVSPAAGAINAVIPLVDGESVVSEQSLTGAGVAVALGPEQQRAGWQSTLERTSALTLRAEAGASWREVWRVRVGHMWNVDFDGVPENSLRQRGTDRWAEFTPRPGESLTLRIARPEAVEGRTLAFDRVTARTVVGGQLRHTTMDVAYRSTRGGTHRLGLPENARLRSVAVDGEAQQLSLAAGILELPILPGDHLATVAWEQPDAVALRVATPTIDLGTASSNIRVGLDMPESRWLLLGTGPVLGPAILYWSELLALVAAALLLGRFNVTPLRWWHWLLLGVGFSTFSWPALAVVALWLLAFGGRATWGAGWSRLVYNLSQIGLAMLTVVAFAAIIVGIPAGLLGSPDMHVTGYESEGRRLTWFIDQTETTTPAAAAWSLPIWTYKVLILAWALWLSFALVRWLPWVWGRFAERGLWVGSPKEDVD